MMNIHFISFYLDRNMNMHTFSIIHNLRSRADRADRSLDGSLALTRGPGVLRYRFRIP
jgi:hypothetical protein